MESRVQKPELLLGGNSSSFSRSGGAGGQTGRQLEAMRDVAMGPSGTRSQHPGACRALGGGVHGSTGSVPAGGPLYGMGWEGDQ